MAEHAPINLTRERKRRRGSASDKAWASYMDRYDAQDPAAPRQGEFYLRVQLAERFNVAEPAHSDSPEAS